MAYTSLLFVLFASMIGLIVCWMRYAYTKAKGWLAGAIVSTVLFAVSQIIVPVVLWL